MAIHIAWPCRSAGPCCSSQEVRLEPAVARAQWVQVSAALWGRVSAPLVAALLTSPGAALGDCVYSVVAESSGVGVQALVLAWLWNLTRGSRHKATLFRQLPKLTLLW